MSSNRDHLKRKAAAEFTVDGRLKEKKKLKGDDKKEIEIETRMIIEKDDRERKAFKSSELNAKKIATNLAFETILDIFKYFRPFELRELLTLRNKKLRRRINKIIIENQRIELEREERRRQIEKDAMMARMLAYKESLESERIQREAEMARRLAREHQQRLESDRIQREARILAIEEQGRLSIQELRSIHHKKCTNTPASQCVNGCCKTCCFGRPCRSHNRN